jgi:hypothetical protein
VAANAQSAAVGCWAASLADCDQKITREHVVSQCLFESDEITVQGFHWCLKEPKIIGLSNLVAKILCKKHNSDLSEVDSAALNAFNVFRQAIHLNDVRAKIERTSIWNIKRFEIDGPRLELWFLKTLVNLSFGREWTIGAGSHPEGTVSEELVKIAFGMHKFGNGAGLYIVARAGDQIDSMDRVNFTPMTEGKNLVAGRFNFRGYTFFLSLLPQKFDKFGDSDLLYRDVTLNCRVQERLSHVIKIVGW